jgi:hypothetical protein
MHRISDRARPRRYRKALIFLETDRRPRRRLPALAVGRMTNAQWSSRSKLEKAGPVQYFEHKAQASDRMRRIPRSGIVLYKTG